MLTVSPAEKLKNILFKESGLSKVKVMVDFQDLEEGTEIQITFTPDATKFGQTYRLEGEPKTLTVYFDGSPSPEELKNAEKRGATISGLNTYAAATLETASLALSFLSFDPSGSLMRLSQMMKIYCRFRFLDINYGSQLATYFEFSAKKSDPPSNRPLREIVSHS